MRTQGNERMTDETSCSDIAAGRNYWDSDDELFPLLVESVRDYAIFMLDCEGRVRSWNSGAERAKGYLREEILGHHFSVFYTPEDRIAGRPQWILNEACRSGRVEDEGWRVRKDGTRFWADVVVTAMRAPDGTLRGYSKVTRDMTEKGLLTAARDETLRASAVKSAFLANMSHELRTPLNAIIGYSEMVIEEMRSMQLTALAEDMEKIRFSSRHLLSIISDVLDLSRIEGGALDLDAEKVATAELLADVTERARPLADRNRNEIVVIPDTEGCVVMADRQRLRQVLYNVFSNACKFTADGRITLSARRSAGEIEIAVQDTGKGIAPEDLERIFEKFYYVGHEVGSSANGGTGLGLAVSQLLVRAMGGRLEVKSALGKGSSFSIFIPAAPAA